MLKLLIQQIDDSLNEKYSQPEKLILFILLFYLLVPTSSAEISQSTLTAVSQFIKVIISVVVIRNFFNHIELALDELKIQSPKHWILNKTIIKFETTHPSIVNIFIISLIFSLIIILITILTKMESPLLIGFAASFFSKWILNYIHTHRT